MRAFPCKDCGVNTVPRAADGKLDRGTWEDYTVHDEVWLAAGMAHHPEGEDAADEFKEYLCIGCLEKRLGRELTAADFTGALINHDRELYTPRLRDRLSRGRGMPVA